MPCRNSACSRKSGHFSSKERAAVVCLSARLHKTPKLNFMKICGQKSNKERTFWSIFDQSCLFFLYLKPGLNKHTFSSAVRKDKDEKEVIRGSENMHLYSCTGILSTTSTSSNSSAARLQ